MTDSPSGGYPKMVTGLFTAADAAERAYLAAIERGYEKSQINLVMSDETRNRCFSGNRQIDKDMAHQKTGGKGQPTTAADDLGGPVGGTVGTIAPAIAAVGALMLIPGLVLAGPVAIALAAAGAVGVAGGLIGALTNWGIPKTRIEEYEAAIRGGGILLGVQAKSAEDASYFEQRWKAEGGRLVHS